MDKSQALSRRSFLRLGSVAGLAVAIPILSAPAADAAIAWCRTDPVIHLKTPDEKYGNNASVYLSAKAELWEVTNSSGSIVVEHPKDAKTNKLWEEPKGYFGQGVSTNFAINESLRFRSRHMDVRVRCYIPASRSGIPILLEWAPGPILFDSNGAPLPATVIASALGYSNQWITLSSMLPYR